MNNNYPHIMLGQPIVIDLNETKEKAMSTNETTTKEKPKVNIGNLEIEIDVNKGSDRFIITKKYQGSKLFYKKHRRACSSYLSKGTHFDTLKEAQDHFDSFIKSNWKHTKQFQIEPVSNFFISNWQLVANDTYSYNSHDLGNKNKLVLRNVPISIDEYKRGSKKVTTVKELIEKFVTESNNQKQYDERDISNLEVQSKKIAQDIEMKRLKIADRTNKLATLLQHDTTIEDLIEQNTTEAERTVKLFYGKE